MVDNAKGSYANNRLMGRLRNERDRDSGTGFCRVMLIL
jgi:hypothetical protein